MKRIHFLEDDALNSSRKVRKEQKDKKWVRKEKVAERLCRHLPIFKRMKSSTRLFSRSEFNIKRSGKLGGTAMHKNCKLQTQSSG